jgi:hypothetical protein
VRNESGKKFPIFGNKFPVEELDTTDRPWGGPHQRSKFMSGFGDPASAHCNMASADSVVIDPQAIWR